MRWAVGGTARSVTRAARRSRDAITGAGHDGADPAAGRAEGIWGRSGSAEIAEGVRANRRGAAVWTALGLLAVIWIGWTAYVWTSHGARAGIGVLISWPAIFAALALVSAPFVGGAMLSRRGATEGSVPDEVPDVVPGESAAASSGFAGGPPVSNPAGDGGGGSSD